MIDYKYGDLFLKNSVDKQIVIEDDTGTVKITNKELYSQKFELTETLCSEEQLVFGSCEASVIKFTAANVFVSVKGKWINANMTLEGNTDVPFCIGRYKVQSDKPTADRRKREYIAYDALYDIINTDVSNWYKTLLPNENSTTTLKAFRDSFFAFFGIEQEEITLINDDMQVEKTIEPSELSGKVVINCICEINGCFGHIGRDGKFKYIYLEPISEGIYPSETRYPNATLYPAKPNTTRIDSGSYISATYEDYLVEKITKLQIRQEEDDIGAIVGDGTNAYVIQDNFLVYGKTAEDLEVIAQNIFDKISGVYYRPFNAKVKGNPCLEVGDSITLITKYQGIMSYVLQRTLTGIQFLHDDISAEGSQYQPSQINSVNRSIQQLQGRYNRLTRTVDETRSEIGNLETKTETRFIQTDEKILLEAERASEAEASLNVRADQITVSVNTVSENLKNNYYTITETDTKIDASAEGILLDVSKKYYTVTEAGTDIAKLQSQIDINAGNILLKTSSDEVQSMIEVALDEVVITSKQIRLEGYTTINGGFSIGANGKVTLSDEQSTASLSSGSFYVSGSAGTSYLSPNSLILGNVGVINSTGNGIEIDANIGRFYDGLYSGGYNVITESTIYDYITDYSAEIDAMKARILVLENLLNGGSWTYLQLEGYDGDEYAYSYFTK